MQFNQYISFALLTVQIKGMSLYLLGKDEFCVEINISFSEVIQNVI